jgi:hypothetical protein
VVVIGGGVGVGSSSRRSSNFSPFFRAQKSCVEKIVGKELEKP